LKNFFFLANPAFFVACAEDSDGFQYGEADMLEVVVALNGAEALDLESPVELGGYQVDFQLVQATGTVQIKEGDRVFSPVTVSGDLGLP